MSEQLTYTPSQIARMAGVTRRTVYRWLDDRRITFTKVGLRSVRITDKAWQEFWARKTVERRGA